MWQKFIAAGYLTRDPEMRFTPQGKAVTNFTIGINDYKDETLWMKVTVWGDRAETVNQYLKKGSGVLVEGKLKHEGGNPVTFVSKKDGQTYSSFEMTAYDVKFLPRGQEEQPQEEEVPW